MGGRASLWPVSYERICVIAPPLVWFFGVSVSSSFLWCVGVFFFSCFFVLAVEKLRLGTDFGSARELQ